MKRSTTATLVAVGLVAAVAGCRAAPAAPPRSSGALTTVVSARVLHLGGMIALAVSCSSTSECLAVGGLANSGAVATIERGRAGPPRVLPHTSDLRAVSCYDRTTCVVAGENNITGSRRRGFAEFIDGAHLARSISVPSTLQVDGVWCASSGRCIVAGMGVHGTTITTATAVESFTRRGVVTGHVFKSAGWPWGGLACRSPSNCELAGQYYVGRPQVPGWATASAWSEHGLRTTRLWHGGMFGVSALSRSSWIVTGGYEASKGPGYGVIGVVHPGARAREVVVPAAGSLYASSCTGSRCIIVGDLDNSQTNPQTGALFEWKGGTARMIYRAPTGTVLYGLACPSIGHCVAVGEDASGHGVAIDFVLHPR